MAEIVFASYGSEHNPLDPRRSGPTRQGLKQAEALGIYLRKKKFDQIFCPPLSQAMYAATKITGDRFNTSVVISPWLYFEEGSPDEERFRTALLELGESPFELFQGSIGETLGNFGWEAQFSLRPKTVFTEGKKILVITHPLLVQAIVWQQTQVDQTGLLLGCDGYIVRMGQGLGIKIEEIRLN